MRYDRTNDREKLKKNYALRDTDNYVRYEKSERLPDELSHWKALETYRNNMSDFFSNKPHFYGNIVLPLISPKKFEKIIADINKKDDKYGALISEPPEMVSLDQILSLEDIMSRRGRKRSEDVKAYKEISRKVYPRIEFYDPKYIGRLPINGDLSRWCLDYIRSMAIKKKTEKDLLVQSHLRLSHSIAQRYKYRGVELDNLIQEGNIGLMIAVDRFDYKRGYAFSTYGTHWIESVIRRAIADSGRHIRIPVHIRDKLTPIIRYEREIMEKEGRKPTIGELAGRFSLTEEKIRSLKEIYANRPLSMEDYMNDDSDRPLSEVVADEKESVEEQVVSFGLKQEIAKMLASIPNREAEILRKRHGIDGEEMTLDEIGEELGVTRERVRQLEAKALRRLRYPGRSGRLKPFLT